ncbi:MAG TPA: hypothetical protein VGT44_03560, partial [Ktedonobacteraceae bacterium]|nr:hypothetical protein [Ktedonobacteraceae bacterium]
NTLLFYNVVRLMSKKLVAIVLLAGTFALLSGGALARPTAHANYGDLSVVGPPSLPAATVNAIFTRLGSPMSGTGAIVEQLSQQTQIDDAFALGVWWTETNDGASGVGLADRNPGSVRGSVGYPSAYDGYTIYPTYTDAIAYWFHMLRNLYVESRGLTTVYAISHPYVGTSNSPLWADKVIALMLRYRGEAPPPTPMPTLMPSPTFSPYLPHHHPAAYLGAGAPVPTTTVQWSGQPQGTLADSTQTGDSGSIATWLTVLAALLLALAIALWAVRYLPGVKLYVYPLQIRAPDAPPPDAHKGHPYMSAGRPANPMRPLSLPVRPAVVPDVKYAPTSLFVRLPETLGVGKIRRVMLLPERQEGGMRAVEEATDEEEATAKMRSVGLMARYGQRPQE